MFGITDNIDKVFIWTPFSSDKQLSEQKWFLYHLKLFETLHIGGNSVSETLETYGTSATNWIPVLWSEVLTIGDQKFGDQKFAPRYGNSNLF